MRKHMLIGAVAAIAGVFLAFAAAAPASAATNLTFGSQVCHANGTVSGTLSWTPSGQGAQRVDLGTNANFSNVSTGGPFASNVSAVNFVQLAPAQTYYARVRTSAPSGTITSATLAITTRSCVPGDGTITKPSNLNATPVSSTGLRFSWTPGNNNRWYCVDTAPSLGALLNKGSGWRNHGCWNTSNALTVSNLACGTQHYWLVYTWNSTSNIKSDPAIAQTGSCAALISPPTNLQAAARSDGGVTFSWNAGTGNTWYCVDTAPSQNALLNVNAAAGWRNHGCWNTSTQLTVHGLDCSTQYFWLVYTWNRSANTKSNVSTVQTADCPSQLQLAPIVSVDTVKVGNTYRAEIRAALPNGCHTADSHQVERTGNTFNVTVWNRVAPGPCTLVYGEYDLTVNLATGLTPGLTYQVVVNGVLLHSFVAQ